MPNHSFINRSWLKIIQLTAIVSGLALASCQWLIFQYAPLEKTMKTTQKIFYLHVPLAWWGLFSFFIVFIASILYLVKKNYFWDALAEAASSIGLILAILALVTGMIWAKYAWGIWWTWDARLTTTLIMCFVYSGYLSLRNVSMSRQKCASISAVIGIISFLDVPLVFFSARLWSHIHPKTIEPSPEMVLTVLCCLLAFGMLWISLLTLHCRLILVQKNIEDQTSNTIFKQE